MVTGWKITKETSRVGGFSLNWPDKKEEELDCISGVIRNWGWGVLVMGVLAGFFAQTDFTGQGQGLRMMPS